MSVVLIIMRHGKAEPFGIAASDFERTLVPRGASAARFTGRALAKKGFRPGLLIASAAPRALYSLKLAAAEMGLDPESAAADRSLYAADGHALLDSVRAIPDSVACAMLCGHNPAVSELTALLGSGGAFLGTAEAIVLRLESWKNAGSSPAEILEHIVPPNPGRE